MSEANKEAPRGGKIKNLWNRMGLDSGVGAYVSYDDRENREFIWRKYIINEKHERSIFRNLDRIKMIDIIIGQVITYRRMIKQGFLHSSFPLHNTFELYGKPRFIPEPGEDMEEKLAKEVKMDDMFSSDRPQSVKESWTNFLVTPKDSIRLYFGEKLGLYFAFLSFYTRVLIPIAIIGLPIFIVQKVVPTTHEVYKACTGIYAICLIVWLTSFYEFWSQRELRWSVLWGQTNFLEFEVERPAYHGKHRRSPVTDQMEVYFSPKIRVIRLFLSILVSAFIFIVILCTIFGIFTLRAYLIRIWSHDSILVNVAQIIASLLNAIQIVIFNAIYSKIAYWMTNFENHKTQSSYEKSLILKSCLFQFINSFNSLFYIAYIKRSQVGCITKVNGKTELSHNVNCMAELQTAVQSIMIVMVIKNLTEVIVPWLTSKINTKKLMMRYKTEPDTENEKLLKLIETQFILKDYKFKELDGTYQDYLELMIQLGYVGLFSSAFTIGPLLAFINNVIEIQVDKAKIMYFTRRPIPEGAENIGIWKIIFYAITTLSIFNTAGIICVTTNAFFDDSKSSFILFIFGSISLLFLKVFIQTLIPDRPEMFQTILSRHDAVIEKCFFQIETNDMMEKQKDKSYVYLKLFEDIKLMRNQDLQDPSSCEIEFSMESDMVKAVTHKGLDLSGGQQYQNDMKSKIKTGMAALPGVDEQVLT